MPLGAIIIDGARYSGSLITERLAWSLGGKCLACRGSEQGAKLLTCAEDGIEELPTPVRAALTKLEQPEAQATQLAGGAVVDRQRTENLRVAQFQRSPAD